MSSLKKVLAVSWTAVVVAAFVLGSATVRAAPPSRSFTIAAVGDIACAQDSGNNLQVCQYDDVAALVASLGVDRFLVPGDVQYESGEYENFLRFYDPTFGPLKPITAPSPGNHDYGTSGAAGYFAYFEDVLEAYGPTAGSPHGYYSFDLGSWHIISLNSQRCRVGFPVPVESNCGPGSAMHEWLRQDLRRHPNNRFPCTIAYWHHPLFDWETYENADWFPTWDTGPQKPLWDLLYANSADVVLVGHAHNYQRWAPQDPEGNADPEKGLTQFVVGTGGRSLTSLGHPPVPANLVAAQDDAFGVLRMTLGDGTYAFEFLAAGGQPAYADAGTGACH
ncbi:MAG: metallophosphoesterase family protein [Methanobacteriota archaeon]